MRAALNPQAGPTPETTEAARKVFDTDLGWIGIVVSTKGLERVFFDCESEAHAAVLTNEWTPVRDGPRAARFKASDRVTKLEPDTLAEEIEMMLVDFASGREVELISIPIASQNLTAFQRAVTQACQRIPYGETRSYGQLAADVNSPRAARAVGTVMAKNCTPLVVPCHRVVGSHGAMGGFSSRRGLGMKQRLLDLEQRSLRRFADFAD